MTYLSSLYLTCAYAGFMVTTAKAAYGKYLESLLLMFHPEIDEEDIYFCVSFGYFMFGFGITGLTNDNFLPLFINFNTSLAVGIFCMIYGFYISRDRR